MPRNARPRPDADLANLLADDPLASFWMGGFEGADHLDARGRPLDMASAHGHIAQLAGDHRRAAALGLGTVRESIGWRLAEPAPGVHDLARARRIALSAQRHGLQVVWTLMHYGTPSDLTVFDDAMVERFVAFALAAARVVAPLGEKPPVFNLINEIGYLAWAASQPRLMRAARTPKRGSTRAKDNAKESTLASGFAVKRRLALATLEATAAVRREWPQARFLQIEPLVHVEPPRDKPELAPLARRISGYQWQVWDLLSGRLEPALGGHPGALDLIGVNHYHSGQWEVPSERRLEWRSDLRRRPFGALLQDTWKRYRRPIVVAETGHVGEGRADWFNEIASEVRSARREGVPVRGFCLYPLIDRPDWNDAAHWHHSGLWDVDRRTTPPAADTFRRVLCVEYAAALKGWQAALGAGPVDETARDCLVVFSPLRWGFGDQRPQQLMLQLARHYRVLYVEEPKLRAAGEPRLERVALGPQIERLVPHTPVRAAGFHDDQLAVLGPMLAAFLQAQRGTARWVAWFYTPMALPLLGSLPRPRAVVYDCMEAPRLHPRVPRQWQQRETALMKIADLVFAAGPSLEASRRALRPAPQGLHSVPSGVDAEHFAPERQDAGNAHAFDVRGLQQNIPAPRLGFAGTLDERLDIGLVAAIADARPGWQLVMVGPVVNIDRAALPQRPNLHWIGPQSWLRRPHWIAGWDACLLPFVVDDATRLACPAEALEAMAAAKPWVSTPLPDLAMLYGDTVRIAATHEAFIGACDDALAEVGEACEGRIAAMRTTARQASWQRRANTVHTLLQRELKRPTAQPLPIEAGAAVVTALEPAVTTPATVAPTVIGQPR